MCQSHGSRVVIHTPLQRLFPPKKADYSPHKQRQWPSRSDVSSMGTFLAISKSVMGHRARNSEMWRKKGFSDVATRRIRPEWTESAIGPLAAPGGRAPVGNLEERPRGGVTAGRGERV
jgi:hypothetical protein